MTERQKLILLAVVREYIKDAQPVASRLIFEKYGFEISPATFRNEFVELEEMGYLSQPYTSAGRMPTDTGYRFFVNYLLEKRSQEKERMQSMFMKLLKAKKEQDAMFSELASIMSGASQNTVISGLLDSSIFFKSGINEVLSQPELDDREQRQNFGALVDSFEKNLPKLLNEMSEDDVSILIGEESTFKGGGDFTVILSKCNLSGSEGMVAIIGPKRMDYDKNIKLINSLKRLL